MIQPSSSSFLRRPNYVSLIMSRYSSSHIGEDYCTRVVSDLHQFYHQHSHFGASHGLPHVMAVHAHALNAIESHRLSCNDNKRRTGKTLSSISDMTATEIRVAALLHDVDDKKYFPHTIDPDNYLTNFPNALMISQSAGIPSSSISRIIKMISWVSCTENGNSIPPEIEPVSNKHFEEEYYQQYHYLIPRWSDRLEAVGSIGVVRCYQYIREIGAPLWKHGDPCPKSEEEVWMYATRERFEAYLKGKRYGESNSSNMKGSGSSMISHYYDKLLHVARPPAEIVRNKYLVEQANESCRELIEVCLCFGKTGVVDEGYILRLEDSLSLRS